MLYDYYITNDDKKVDTTIFNSYSYFSHVFAILLVNCQLDVIS